VIDTDPDRDWGPSPNELAQLARRCGCVVELSQTLGDGSTAYELKCPNHPAKVRLLAELAEYDSKHPEVIRLAEKLAALGDGDPWTIAQIVHAFVRDGVRHLPEPREKFQPTMRTLALGIGDCDDTSRAVMALLRAAGLRGGLLTLGNPPRHVSAAIQLQGNWRWLDASLAARPGEHPITAAKRLGLSVRQDLSQLGQAGGDNDTAAINIPNLITMTGFSLGVAWAAGGPDWMGLASVALDDVDGYVARKYGQASKFGGLLDWATDQVLTPLVWHRMDLPFRFYPPVALGQIAARHYGIKPTGWVPSLRGGLMLFDIGRRYLKRRKRKRRR
jgi:hypothetical protein